MMIRRKKSFFTLLEVLISMGVFAVLMLALMQFFVSARDIWDKTGTKAQLYDNTRIAMDLLTKDLMTAFYGEEYDLSQYRLFQCDIPSLDSNIQVTFAAQRIEGLTEVNYTWDSSALTFSVATILETDTSPPNPVNGAVVSSTKNKNPDWCTYPSTAWISTIRDTSKATPYAILDNILAFHITCKNYSSTTHSLIDVTSTAKLPPYMVEITMAVMDPLVYDLLVARIRARLGASTTEDAARNLIKTTFKNMLEPSYPQKGFKDSSNFAEGSEELILYQGTQFFKRAVIIDQGRYQ